MGFNRQLIHTCTIQPYTVAQDARGAPAKTEGAVFTKIPCRLIHKRERRPMPDLGFMSELMTMLLLPATTTVTIEDTVTNIRTRNENALVDADVYDVDEILTRRRRKDHHLELRLKKVE